MDDSELTRGPAGIMVYSLNGLRVGVGILPPVVCRVKSFDGWFALIA